MKPRITLIAAIGQQGQLGRHGKLPWQGLPHRIYAEDLSRFREITAGAAVVVGHHTWPSVRHLDGTNGRSFVNDCLRRSPGELAEAIVRRLRKDRIFIAGGAKTYGRWMHLIDDFDVTRLPYNGEANVYAEFLLPHVTREVSL
ncbi:dihydrofolate reductase [uncultured Methylobacterium sp.]|uniref:dihydrofolate reductase n=1 Tax=uncultured Methylobacterium sp. TaxID=157278 RepID=UPI002632CF7B|nr:dihydrofolate reductase [uncultured Methylobacterium sp.]